MFEKPYFYAPDKRRFCFKTVALDFLFEPFDKFRNGIGLNSGRGAVVAGSEAVSCVQLVDPFTGFDEGINGWAITSCE